MLQAAHTCGKGRTAKVAHIRAHGPQAACMQLPWQAGLMAKPRAPPCRVYPAGLPANVRTMAAKADEVRMCRMYAVQHRPPGVGL
jgi:hypothetical protein